MRSGIGTDLGELFLSADADGGFLMFTFDKFCLFVSLSFLGLVFLLLAHPAFLISFLAFILATSFFSSQFLIINRAQILNGGVLLRLKGSSPRRDRKGQKS